MPDDTHQSETSLLPEVEDADEAVVTFHPQMWKNDYAVSGDSVTYRVPIEDALTDDGNLRTEHPDTDALAHHENAPEKAQNWYGPFYVTIDELR
jgi:hypothetical protein